MTNLLTIVMPVFNEDEGIEEFIDEIRLNFRTLKPTIVAIDDCSTDLTWSILRQIEKRSDDLILVRNKINLGHGPSTIIALKHGLLTKSKHVMAIDGDGQFLGQEMFNFYENFCESNLSYGEGNRVYRKDPWFRKTISLLTRLIVWAKSKSKAVDANTPARIYEPNILKYLLERVDNASLVPNLRISILVRKQKIEIFTGSLRHMPRRAQTMQGSSWGNGTTIFPSRRLIFFCFNAMKEFF
jgi:glycosyltransferase involved in cell wall biosynthesis